MNEEQEIIQKYFLPIADNPESLSYQMMLLLLTNSKIWLYLQT